VNTNYSQAQIKKKTYREKGNEGASYKEE